MYCSSEVARHLFQTKTDTLMFQIIRESIAPKLQKLQDERAQFQEYQKVVRELENLTRLHIAYK